MPEKTIDAVADHGEIKGDTVTGTAAAAQEVFDKLEAVGRRPDRRLRGAGEEGVDKFVESWTELLEETQKQLDSAAK